MSVSPSPEPDGRMLILRKASPGAAARRWILLAGGMIAAWSCFASAFDGQPKSKQPAVAPRPRGVSEKVQPTEKQRTMTIVVSDERGKPVANAGVTVSRWDGRTQKRHESCYKSSKSGRVTFSFPVSMHGSINIHVRAAKYADMQAQWQSIAVEGFANEPIPQTFRFRLQPGVRLGGKVVDEYGRPIANATVRISAADSRTGPSARVWRETSIQTKTGKDGTWKTAERAAAEFTEASLTVEHPDFVNRGKYDLGSAVERSQLRALTHKLTLERGFTVQGFVRSPEGKPVAGALLALQHVPHRAIDRRATTRTNPKGHYRFEHVAKGPSAVTVVAKGLAPEFKRFEVSDELDSLHIQLKPGKTLRVRVVDFAGKPLVGATLLPGTWRGQRSLSEIYKECIPYKTGKDGRLVWNGAPADEMTFNVFPPEPKANDPLSMRLYPRKLTAREKEYVVKLPQPLRVTVRVVDANTKKPVSRFRVAQGQKLPRSNDYFWSPVINDGRDGRLRLLFDFFTGSRYYRVQAKGYQSIISREVKDDEGTVTLNFELKRSQGPQAVVIDAAGKPIARAKVYLCKGDDVFGGSLFLANGANVRGGTTSKTDAKGRFEFEPQDGAFAVFIVADSGSAFISGAELGGKSKITVTPWARVEGTFRIGAKPGASETMALDRSDFFTQIGNATIYFNYKATTDKKGRFVFEKVPSHWPVQVSREIFLSRTPFGSARTGKTHAKRIELTPGKTTKVNLGGKGRPVIGRLQLPEGVEAKGGWHASMSRYTVSEALDPALLPAPDLLFRFPLPHALRVKADGSFRIEDLPPGKYELSAQTYEPLVREKGKFKRPKILGKLKHSFTIEPIPGGRTDKPLQLGTLKLNTP